MKQITQMTPFKVMTSLLNNSQPTEKEILTLNSFFMCRWLSNDPNTLPMGNIVNMNYNMPLTIQYKFCEDYIAIKNLKEKVSFIKSTKDKQNKDFQKLMDNIQKKYKINEIIAQDYYNLMDNDEKNKIYNMYNEGRQ